MNKNEFKTIQTNQPLGNLSIAKKLLLMQLHFDLKVSKLEEALNIGDLNECFLINLLDIVADLLGVPEDNTLEHYNEDTGTYTDDYYCRDWFYDLWSPTYDQEAIDDPDEYVLNYIICITEAVKRRSR
tara:strand:- start:201 stop:584 length:384 start_codon:yes stop_codon:yes gene_type:complete